MLLLQALFTTSLALTQVQANSPLPDARAAISTGSSDDPTTQNCPQQSLAARSRRVAQAAKPTKNARKPAKRKPRALAKKRAKVRQRIRTLRAWRLTEALDLDEQTAARLFPILSRFDGQFEGAMQKASRLRESAQAELERKSPNQAKLDAIVDQMVEQQRALWKLQEARFQAVRKVLTPAQSAKILIILPEIDRTLHRQIRRAMRTKAGAPIDPFAGTSDPPPTGSKLHDPFTSKPQQIDSGSVLTDPFQ